MNPQNEYYPTATIVADYYRGSIKLCLFAWIYVAWLIGATVEAVEVADGQAKVEQYTSPTNPTNHLGSWIWSAETFDRQTCRLWRAFEIPASNIVTHAKLLMTADNDYKFFLDGREVGRGAEWRHLYQYDLTLLLSPGKHVLAIEAFNSDAQAGVLFGLHVEMKSGRGLEIKSDSSWRIVPDGTRGWEKKTEPLNTWPVATIVAQLGGLPVGGLPWWVTPEAIEILPTMQPIRIYFWQTGWFQIALLSVCGVVILISLRLAAQLALHKKERLLLQRERARIARDIHDDLGSRITQLVLHGEVAQSELSAESNVRGHLDRICQEARGVLSTLDEILWAVNPRRDALNEFSSYVCAYAEEFLKPTPIQCLFDVDSEASTLALDLPLRRALLMGIKETLNNAVKYSGASELLLQIKCSGKNLVVAVQDNGKGFDLKNVSPDGNGLFNITQRMNEQGGNCVITSQPGKGCRVEFTLTLKSTRPQPLYWLSKPGRISTPTDPDQKANEASQDHATN